MFLHEALLYGSEEDFLAAAVPFVDEGAALGETSLLGVEPRLSRAVLEAVRDPEAVAVVEDAYHSPLATLRANHELFTGASEPMRIIGQIPDAGLRDDWHGWARYEAVANDFFAPFRVSALCAYDTRTTPDTVLQDVVFTHPRVCGADGPTDNLDYIEPAAFLTLLATAEIDPLERARPRFIVDDPDPADAREAVIALARGVGLDAVGAAHLGLAVREVVANAIEHGEPPVRACAWTDNGRVAVAVSDCGPGPEDPYAGLMPDRSRWTEEGLGLHIAYQVCEVALTYSERGFTVHLVSRGGCA